MDETEIVRWYTHARRFQRFIGKVGGTRLPFPLPLSAVCGAGLAMGLSAKTVGIWSTGSFVYDTAIIAALGAAAGFGAARIGQSGRNPAAVIAGAYRSVRPGRRFGELAGRPIRLPRPVVVRRPHLEAQPSELPAIEQPAAPLQQDVEVVPAPPPTPVVDRSGGMSPQPALTGVQALLATARSDHGR